MKNAGKAVITKDTKTLKDDGVIHLQLSGEPLEEVKHFVRLRKLGPGSVVQFKMDDRESKSCKQLKTVHLLIQIYDKFLQENVDGYIDIADLKNKVKYKYGVIEYWEAPDNKVIATLKSFAKYKMSELAKVITGLMDEMIKTFAPYRYMPKQFEEMIQAFNSQKIEPEEEIPIF
jgi:hypothetical protein